MKSMERKKQIEKRQLCSFWELYLDFPVGLVEPGEEPDFVVCGDKIVGVELTGLYWENLHNEVPRRAIEDVRYRICQKAREAYRNKDLPRVNVSLHFNETYSLTKKMINTIAGKITHFVESNIPEINEKYTETNEWGNRAYFPEEIDLISIYRFDELSDSYFSCSDEDFIPDCSISAIKKAIEKKDEKYDSYRNKCSEAWLLLNINDGGLSSNFDIPEAVVQEIYESKFDKIFLIQHSEKKLYELTIRPYGAHGV